MTGGILAWRSVVYHRRSLYAAGLGVAIAACVLTGALLVGSSARQTLIDSALLRLGGIQYALDARGRYLSADLAGRIEKSADIIVAPVLELRGVALAGTGEEGKQLGRIRVLGVDDRFWQLSGGPRHSPGESGVMINEEVARRLGVAKGDEISLRIDKPGILSRDAPLSAIKDSTIRRVFTVNGVVPDANLGLFQLEANQQVPRNIFIDREVLADLAGIKGRANLMLADELKDANIKLSLVSRLADEGLNLREIDDGAVLQMESDRIFLPAPAADAILSGLGEESVGAFTYLATSLSDGKGERETPYSFVTALSPASDQRLGVAPAGMKDDEVILNQWCAEQLGVTTGETVRMGYLRPAAGNRYEKGAREFRVRTVCSMDEMRREKELMPVFPGMADVENCADWDIGMPMDEEKLKDKANEEYWDRYRETPKAIVTLRAGREMWGSRFGNVTAIRVLKGARTRDDWEARLLAISRQAGGGLAFQDVRANAMKAAGEGTDFGMLFTGMSSFLVMAALVLVALLFMLNAEQRSAERGILSAVGFSRSRIQRWLLLEGMAVALPGVLIGTLAGPLFTKLLIRGLSGPWSGAVAGAKIRYHGDWHMLAAGAVATLVVTMAALVWAGRREAGRPVLQNLLPDARLDNVTQSTDRWRAVAAFAFSLFVLAAAIFLVAGAKADAGQAAQLFFGAGALILLAGMGAAYGVFSRGGGRWSNHFSLFGLAWRNVCRKRSRSMAVLWIMASGLFLVVSVISMRPDLPLSAGTSWPGSGGFTMICETTLPVPWRLTDPQSRKKAGLRGEYWDRVRIMPVKVHDGEDGGCENLNRAQTPRLLGVDPDEMTGLGAFMPRGEKEAGPWQLLHDKNGGSGVPALVGDANTAQWTLRRKSGDILQYRDEMGLEFPIRIAGSLPVPSTIFNGSLLIAEEDLGRQYPNEAGYRMLLLKVPAGLESIVERDLRTALYRYGVEIVSAGSRLKELARVEVAYLAAFLLLGGIGLVLGSAGLAVILRRNVLERRGELACLRAIGYSKSLLWRLVVTEHALLFSAALGIGIIASLLALWPTFRFHEAGGMLVSAALMVALAAVCGIAGIGIAARLALSERLTESLRNE